ncbi:unnamed protein product [Phytophthora lilii]|uniref:Unnamed protein product n=1 Tax=Phytophthora lilii TaxID=2077276 RepID=A0A9W7CSQ9_9STRA|nr:unnamed protein product [Phytophthora lilii]
MPGGFACQWHEPPESAHGPDCSEMWRSATEFTELLFARSAARLHGATKESNVQPAVEKLVNLIKLDADAGTPVLGSNTDFPNVSDAGVLGADRYDCDSDSAALRSDADTLPGEPDEGGVSRYLHLLAMRSCQKRKPTNESDEMLSDVPMDM